MEKVKASIGTEHYKVSVQTPTNNSIISDEPISVGGGDLGFSPSELLASSLAACTMVTIRMYADRKEYPLDRAEVEVTFERDKEKNTSTLVRNIKLFGEQLSEEQRQRLLQIANACFIHKTLTNPIEVLTNLVGG